MLAGARSFRPIRQRERLRRFPASLRCLLAVDLKSLAEEYLKVRTMHTLPRVTGFKRSMPAGLLANRTLRAYQQDRLFDFSRYRRNHEE